MTDEILKIESDGGDTACRVVVRGELDLTSADHLTSAVSRLCSNGTKELVLDVADLTFLDSTGLRAILNSRALCEESLCEFALTPAEDDLQEQVRRLLEITDLLGRLPFRRRAGD